MKQTNLIEQLKADLIRTTKQIQQCLYDLDRKIDHLIELHRECRRSGAEVSSSTQVYDGEDDE